MWTTCLCVLSVFSVGSGVRVPVDWNNPTDVSFGHPRRLSNDQTNSLTESKPYYPIGNLVAFPVHTSQQSSGKSIVTPSLPPLLNPRYASRPAYNKEYLAHSEILLPDRDKIKYLGAQQYLQKQLENQNNPAGVTRIKPALTLDQPNDPYHQPLTSPSLYNSQSSSGLLNLYLPNKPTVQRKFIVPATDEEYQYQPQIKETVPDTQIKPAFFVTEGYRNVLVQGPTGDKKKYLKDDKVKRKVIKDYNPGSEYESHYNYLPFNNRKSKIKSQLEKSFRDDRLHEPGIDFDEEREYDDPERLPDENLNDEELEDPDDGVEEATNSENEKVGKDGDNLENEETDEEHVKSEHENHNEPERETPDDEHAEPKDIPTKPIFPGEGQWAKKGLNHRPHVTQHVFLNLKEDEQKPDGHDVFEDLQQFFDHQKSHLQQEHNKFKHQATHPHVIKIKTPKTPNPLVIYDPFKEAASRNSKRTQYSYRQPKIEASPSQYQYQEPASSIANEEEEEFVPIKMYSQVRKSEDIKHEPYDPEARLKQVITDKKVQTVYSEEGYEDLAYDHAGHEKKAERDQGYSAFENDKQKKADTKQLTKTAGNDDSDRGQSTKVAVLDAPLLDSIAADSSTKKTVTNPEESKSNTLVPSKKFITKQIKDKNNGDMQLEIESEVKLVLQPNSTAKAHKFVKIFPKVLKDVSKKNFLTINTTSTSPEFTTRDIEKGTESTESVEVLDLKKIKRKKRDTYEKADVDTEFIDKISHTFAPPTTTIKTYNAQKYPYYNKPDVNEDSALRYAVDTKTIPVKRPGDLAFYKTANTVECPDIPQEVDPIPDYVKKSNEQGEPVEDYDEDEDDEESIVDKRRPPAPKQELGDKIDCYKIKYFGENPLDSPFFAEDTISPVKSIFSEFDKISEQNKKHLDTSIRSSEINERRYENGNDVFPGKDQIKFKEKVKEQVYTTTEKNKDDLIETKTRQTISQDTEGASSNKQVFQPSQSIVSFTTTSSPIITLITTPKYTIQLTPNNIYDQIKLLDHLPEDDENGEASTEKVNESSALVEFKRDSRQANVNEDHIDLIKHEAVAESEALRRLRKRPKRPLYEIFDVTKYLPTTPFSVINTAASTVLPKHMVMSEVFYKDDIKPNEQLTVFADILNNIKNSSMMEASVPLQSASNFAEPSAVTISTIKVTSSSPQTNTANKKIQIDNKANSYQNYINSRKPILHRAYGEKIEPQTNRIVKVAYSTTKRPKKHNRKSTTVATTTTTPKSNSYTQESTPNNHQPYIINYIESSDNIIGLVPPKHFHYKTIVPPEDLNLQGSQAPQHIHINPSTTTEEDKMKPVTELQDEVPLHRPLNQYYFLGLKPPVQHLKARPYTDFIDDNKLPNENLVRRRVAHFGHSRFRRSTSSRLSYADLSRNRGKPDDAKLDEVDDYVPHRPKNYHFDEKTGRIIYHNKSNEGIEEDEEDYEEDLVTDSPGIYLERVEDATHPTIQKVTTKELLATATPPPDGKGLLDFVVKLKNNPEYKYIPDPTTAKPGSAFSTTEEFSNPKSTNPPEFLTILSKVKTDANYKSIPEPKQSQSKTSPVIQASEEEEVAYVDDKEESGQVRSRHVRQVNLKIFNVGDYLPKIQTPIYSDIPKNFFKTHVIERIFPRLRYMTPYDIARERYMQTDLYKFIKKLTKNSPGGQNLGNLQIFDIGEYLPTIKPINPKTAVDYSKYKTIERPQTKKQQEETSDSQVKITNSRPPSTTTTTTTIKTPVIITTSQKPFQLRRGTRPSSTTKLIEDNTTETSAVRLRSPNRRKPLPTGFRSTTKRPPVKIHNDGSPEATEKVERVFPQNNSSDDKGKRVHRRQPIRIRHTTERREEDPDSVDKIVRRSLDTTWTTISPENFKGAFQKAYLDSDFDLSYESIKSDILNGRILTPSVFDHVEEKPKNKTTKEQAQVVETKLILNNTTNNQPAEESLKEDQTTEAAIEQKQRKSLDVKRLKDVDVVNEYYDITKKHGGNYKAKMQEDSDSSDEVEYKDKNDHERGDVKELSSREKSNENSENDDPQVAADEPLEDIQITTDISEETLIITTSRPVETTQKITMEAIIVEEPAEEDRDIEPITFETDSLDDTTSSYLDIDEEILETTTVPPIKTTQKEPQLSSHKVQVTEILDQIAQEGDVVEERKRPQRGFGTRSRRYEHFYEDDNDYADKELEPHTTTKKPLFEKDPSKRLYFYVKA
ncbi:hypothetical protein ABEB36_008357 [Hypothenemus hampei]|uniref:Uncharacterized protein n=1 Tax=Hypothenemus hampei TaxID=57062 RepID=A0ABD1EM05_HYPHA